MGNELFETAPLRFYKSELRIYIPGNAYKPAVHKLIPMFFHSLLILGWLSIIRINTDNWYIIIASLFMGISMTSIFHFSHELSHGTIVKNRSLRYILENYFRAFLGIPPTVWCKVHNENHHPTTAKPVYSKNDKKKILFELGYIVIIQTGLFLIVNSWVYLIVLLISGFMYRSLVMLTFKRMHSFNDVLKKRNTILSNKSLIIPRWLDRVFNWQSFKVEHYLFPEINFDYYPGLSEVIKKKFPARTAEWHSLTQ